MADADVPVAGGADAAGNGAAPAAGAAPTDGDGAPPGDGTPAGAGAATGGGSPGAAPGGGGAAAPPPSLPQWSTPVFLAGLIVGLLLIAAGMAVQVLGLGSPRLAMMVAATGLGILLGAFGAAALMQFQGLTIAGVGAVTLAVFLLLTNGAPKYLKISVSNVPSSYQASLYIDSDIPGRRVKEARNQVDFTVLDQEIAASSIKLLFHNADTEVPFDCIPATLVRPLLGSGRTMDWWLAEDQLSLTISEQKVARDCEHTEIAEATGPDWNVLIGTAVAQEALEAVPVLLSDLESSDVTIRRAAREGLAQWGVEAVPEMMQFWQQNPENYRRALGVSVALTELLREDKQVAGEVSNLLQPEDYELLVNAIADPDRTKRIYATEFLFDLGTPAVTDAIVQAFPGASQDGQFNALFVLANVIGKLGAAEKQELVSTVEGWRALPTVGFNTEKKLDDLLAELK